jgi:hypothetical protein
VLPWVRLLRTRIWGPKYMGSHYDLKRQTKAEELGTPCLQLLSLRLSLKALYSLVRAVPQEKLWQNGETEGAPWGTDPLLKYLVLTDFRHHIRHIEILSAPCRRRDESRRSIIRGRAANVRRPAMGL